MSVSTRDRVDYWWAACASGSFGEPSASGLVRRVRDGHALFTGHVSAAAATPAGVATSSRHEVFERIGSGRSFPREQSRRKAPGGRKPPGPWPVKPRLEPLRKEQHHPKKQVRRGRLRCARGPVPTGRRARRRGIRRRGFAAAVPSPRRVRKAQSPRRAESGLRRSSGRARGVFWLQKSTSGAWPIPPDGGRSSLSSFIGASGERASEAGSRRQSCENGGGLPSRPGTGGLCVYEAIRGQAACHGRVEGALVEGRRPGSRRQLSLTRRRAEAGLAHGAGWLGETREVDAGNGGDRMGATRNGEARKGEPG